MVLSYLGRLEFRLDLFMEADLGVRVRLRFRTGFRQLFKLAKRLDGDFCRGSTCGTGIVKPCLAVLKENVDDVKIISGNCMPERGEPTLFDQQWIGVGTQQIPHDANMPSP